MITIVRLFDPWAEGASLLRAAEEAGGRMSAGEMRGGGMPGSFSLDVHPGWPGCTEIGEQPIGRGAIMYIPFPYKLRQQVSPAGTDREKYVRRVADVLVARLAGVRRPVVHIGGHYWAELARRLKREAGAMIVYEFDGNGMMPVADRVLCNSEVAKRAVMERYGVEESKIAVLYHPGPVRTVVRAAARAAYGFDEEETIIVFDKKLAALDYHPRSLLSACGERGDDWQLWVLNEHNATAYREVTDKRHWRRVHFTGGLTKGDAQELYAAADLVILPQPTECNFQDALTLIRMRIPFIVDGTVEGNPWHRELLRQEAMPASAPGVFSRDQLRKELSTLYRRLSQAGPVG